MLLLGCEQERIGLTCPTFLSPLHLSRHSRTTVSLIKVVIIEFELSLLERKREGRDKD